MDDSQERIKAEAKQKRKLEHEQRRKEEEERRRADKLKRQNEQAERQKAKAAEAEKAATNEQLRVGTSAVKVKPVSYNAMNLKPAKRKRTTDETPTENDISLGPAKLTKSNHEGVRTDSASEQDDYAAPSRFAPARKPPRSKVKPVYDSKEVVPLRPTAQSSEWYGNIDIKQKFSRSDVVNLGYLVTLIERCVSSGSDSSDNNKHSTNLNELRTRIHQAEHQQFLKPEEHAAIIKKSRVLEDNGLPRIFDDKSPDSLCFPWDIRADAEALFIRWISGNIESFMLRGLNATQKTVNGVVQKPTYSLNKTWPYIKTANIVGHNDLFNGQWWPLRICALRDGAHGGQEAGIHGQPGTGAIAVAIAEGGYADRDNGLEIQYCGTESQNVKPTRNTELMLESCRNKNVIRVLRGKNHKSEYAPKEGIRYDGLYRITAHELLKQETAMYRFTLVREEGQDPIRFKGPEARPSPIELAERAKLRNVL